jgi:hypothetical protein
MTGKNFLQVPDVSHWDGPGCGPCPGRHQPVPAAQAGPAVGPPARPRDRRRGWPSQSESAACPVTVGRLRCVSESLSPGLRLGHGDRRAVTLTWSPQSAAFCPSPSDRRSAGGGPQAGPPGPAGAAAWVPGCSPAAWQYAPLPGLESDSE